MNRLHLIFPLILLFSLIFPPPLIAATSVKPVYNFRFVNPPASPSSALVSTSSADLTSPPFKLQTGFPFISTITPFGLTISNLSLNFKDPPPNTLVSQTQTLTVSAGGTAGFSVLLHQNHPLTLLNSDSTIPDTPCDSSCSPASAAPWTSTDIHGYGYSLTGQNISPDFKDSTFFRPLSSTQPQTIISTSTLTPKSTSHITYQLNLSPSQPPGQYRHQLIIIALPSY